MIKTLVTDTEHLQQSLALFRSSPAVSMRGDWGSQVVNREALVFLCINYAFFSVVVLSFILFMIILTHTSSSQDDLLTSMAIMAMCFIFVDLIVANFLVQTMHMNMEVKLIL